jgi:hypothetical protein
VAPLGGSWLRTTLLRIVHRLWFSEGGRYQIGNNRGGMNGWIGPHSIYGRLVRAD